MGTPPQTCFFDVFSVVSAWFFCVICVIAEQIKAMIGKKEIAERYGVTWKTLLKLLNEKSGASFGNKYRKFLTPLEVAVIYEQIGPPPAR